MSEFSNMIIFWMIFSSLLMSTTNNYMSFLSYYILQVCLILVLFFMLFSDSFMHDKVLMASFMFAIIMSLMIIPNYMNYFLKEFYVKKLQMSMTDSVFSMPQSLVFLMLIWFFFLSYYMSMFVFSEMNLIFTVSLFVFFGWLLNFVNHKSLVWDMLSFLEMENAVFLVWLMVLENVPLYIEVGMMMDVIIVLLMLLILVYNMKQVIWDTEISHMNNLKY